MCFDASKVRKELVEWIREWFKVNSNNGKAVLGISGGKDSTICAALCVEALGKENVIGILLPNGSQSDMHDSIEICEHLGIKYYTINIEDGVNATLNQMKAVGIEISRQTIENIPPRERTKVIRAICQSVNGRMINTCNWSEDFIGYFTIGGDGEGDMAPLGDLTKTEVVEIGKLLDIPKRLVEKTPSDGLCGKTDEDNFGFTYDELDSYIRNGYCENKEHEALIISRHERNLFKLKPIDKFILK